MSKIPQIAVTFLARPGMPGPRPPRFSYGIYALLTVALGVAGCSNMRNVPVANSQTTPAAQPPNVAGNALGAASNRAPARRVRILPSLDPADTRAEAARLQAALHREVHGLLRLSPAQQAHWISMVRQTLEAKNVRITRAQLIVAVDRSPHVQAIMLMVVQPDGPWTILGGTHVSTGQPNRRLYYITPTGVFLHTDAILDYRALGTFNENHIRGLGLKGMRVWDFGWHIARKGWLTSGETGQIRLLIHSTDPANLAYRIGRPASEGCIRIPAEMNKFMDRHGVLDVDYEQAAITSIAYRAILPRDAKPTPLAGDTLVVVDSSEPNADRT